MTIGRKYYKTLTHDVSKNFTLNGKIRLKIPMSSVDVVCVFLVPVPVLAWDREGKATHSPSFHG